MKRLALIVSILAITAVAAQAQTKDKAPAAAKATNAAPCYQANGTTATPEQVQKFLDATTDLRKELFAKNAEYKAILANTNPDAKRAGELAGQIFDLRAKIGAEAKKQGLSQYGQCATMGAGMGCGMGAGGCGGMGGGMMGGGMMGGHGKGMGRGMGQGMGMMGQGAAAQ